MMLRTTVQYVSRKANNKPQLLKQVGSLHIQRLRGDWYFWMPHHQLIWYRSRLNRQLLKQCKQPHLRQCKQPHLRQCKQPPLRPRIYPIQNLWDPELSALMVPKNFRGTISVKFRHSYSGCAYQFPEKYRMEFLKVDFINLQSYHQ